MAKRRNISSGLALFIAGLALVTSFWQGFEERRHNRYSVRPILNIEESMIDTIRTFKLVNNGLGPAIIDEFKVIAGDSSWDSEAVNPWNELVGYKGLRPKVKWMWYYGKDGTVKMDERTDIFAFKADSVYHLDAEVVIKYRSIYDEKMTLRRSF